MHRSNGRLVLLVLLTSTICSDCKYLTDRVTESVMSPDRKAEAIVVERNVSAFTDTIYLVYIVKNGSTGCGTPVLADENFENLKVVWNKQRVLDVEYSKAVISSFRNVWQDPSNSEYIIEIRLRPTTEFPLNSKYL